jgi:iron complex transport system ATP-binding protein
MSGLGVRTERLRLAYGRRTVLHDVDLAIEPGERVCLVGPNGAGKSTLLRCLTGVVPTAPGAVRIDDQPLGAIDRARLARLIAVVPGQVALPFAMRVEDVVALGRIPHEHRLSGPRLTDTVAVDAAIARAGIDHLRGRDARELSLGERQLVLIAMALAQQGRLLILDEPTVHLDLRHQVEVLELLAGLNEREGLTVLAVLHDLSLAAATFPRLVLLAGGRVVADGPPADVLTPERIRDVYGVDPRFLPMAPRAERPDLAPVPPVPA